MRHAIPQAYSEEEVLSAGLAAVERALDSIHAAKDSDFDEYWYRRLRKHLFRIDHDAQKTAEECLQKRLTGIQIRGEESGLYEVRDGLSALLDALDGSDLAKHRLGNWCSALTIFDPGIRKIFAAFVGMPNNEIYFTRHSHTDKAYVRTPTTAGGEILEVEMEPRDVTLKDAAIGYYGQKPAKLLSMTHSRPRFAQWLTHVSKEMQEKKQEEDCPKMRIYNLAGIPMMVNVVEGYLDAVVEVSGQKCHDVVPGFVIALRAKAVLKDLSNHYITEEEIAARLRDPSQTFSYVLACNEALASELVELLQTVS